MKPDDATISDDAVLLRVLVSDDWHTGTPTGRRVTSFAFNDALGETSCYVDTPERRTVLAARYPNFPLGQFTARQARAVGLLVASDPDGDPDGSAEHKVLSFIGSKSARQKACRNLALVSSFIAADGVNPV